MAAGDPGASLFEVVVSHCLLLLSQDPEQSFLGFHPAPRERTLSLHVVVDGPWRSPLIKDAAGLTEVRAAALPPKALRVDDFCSGAPQATTEPVHSGGAARAPPHSEEAGAAPAPGSAE